jgi:hypothetical protein
MAELKNNSRIYFVLIFSLIFGIRGQIHGQKKGDISIGLGFPELPNISVRYKVFDQVRTGISFGWIPQTSFESRGWDNLISFSGNVYYHFGRIISYSGMRIFYVNAGINFILEKPYLWDENWWNSYFRIGGEIYSSYHFGVNIDGGFIYNMNPETNWARMNRLMPAFGFNVAYRFNFKNPVH